jgi:cytochrome c-type biogenesis protein CcmI
MMLFWMVIVLMLLLAATFIVMPLVRKTQADDQQRRDELNAAFYKQRLSEIDSEERDGLVENKSDLIVELKQSLLQDIPDSPNGFQSRDNIPSRLIAIGAVVLLVVISSGMYFSMGSYQQVTDWQQVRQKLPELSARLMQSSGEPLTDQEMEDLNLALRTRLYEKPDDAMGWLLLGKIALAKYDATNAVEALLKAYQLDPNSNSIRYGYAQALLASGEENNKRQAVELLNKLIADGSTDIRVYSLLALYAFDNKQYQVAIDYWHKMQTMLGSNDGRTAWLEEQIAQANQLLERQQNMSDKKITVNVTVSDSVPIDVNGVMIVSVHDAMGSPMPVAAVRMPVPQFPYQLTLDDRNSLMDARLLSSLTQFKVKVRIDSDGNVATREGDVFGESNISNFDQSVAVEVNKRY